MRKLHYILFVLLTLFCLGCEDDVDFRDNSVAQLYLEVGLEPAALPVASLRTTDVINDKNQEILVAKDDDATIILSSKEDNLSRVFVYQEGLEQYAINNFNLIQEGTEYSVTASFNERPDLGEISGTTVVPLPNRIESIEHKSTTIIPVREGFDKDQFEFAIKILPSEHKYYLIEPYADIKRVDPVSGNLIDARLDLDWFEDFVTDQASSMGVTTLEHKNGILVNTDLIEDNTVTVFFTTANDLEEDLDFVPSIHFKFNTVSEGYYFHHLTYSKQLKASGSNAAQAVTSYSNLLGGEGAITSFSTSRDTFNF